MRSLVSSRATGLMVARSVVGLGLLAAFSFGCGVDGSGLGETSAKLQRDAGGPGGAASPTGVGGDTASGGVSGAGGVIGAGGDAASGGVNGAGGDLGSGGSVAVGGAPGTGAGGATATGSGGALATGGSGGAPATGGATGSGGVSATGGMIGTGGMTATGGANGTGGLIGTGGMIATGGMVGTGGVTTTGGVNGMGGAAMGGTTGTGGAGMPCGPATCDGCCASDGQCVHNVTAQQCGSKGAACVACGPCQICGGASGSSGGGNVGTCTINPTSQWTIVADSAQLSMTPPGGGTWDPKTGDEGGSPPDPFCEYENPSGDVSATTAGVTDTVTDAFNPTWDEEITPPGVTVSASALMAAKPAWRIWVGDEDCSGPKNCGTLGQIACSYQQPIAAASLMSGGLTISNYQNCVSLTLSFVCQAPVATP